MFQLINNQQFISGGGNLASLFFKIFGEDGRIDMSSPFLFSKKLLSGYCKCGMPELKGEPDLKTLIEAYRSYGWKQFEACYLMLDSILEFVVGNLNTDKTECKRPFHRSTHQYCMPCITVEESARLFFTHQQELLESTDFEDLYRKVYTLTNEHLSRGVSGRSKQNNFGALAIYDFANRFAYRVMDNTLGQRSNLYPKSVYLQAGALIGAKAYWQYRNLDRKLLAPHSDIDGHPIFISFEDLKNLEGFDKDLLELSPYDVKPTETEKVLIEAHYPMHLENFFCVCEKYLSILAEKNQ